MTTAGTKSAVVGFNADLVLGSGINATVLGLTPRVDLTTVGMNNVTIGFNPDLALGVNATALGLRPSEP